ncbi:MAG: hypothetical protein IKH57_04130 [Clostridia bacterium]|nr:hypothetical protein [Clostridia bacterium]
MKKIVATMLCLVMLLGCAAVAETAEKTLMGTVSVKGAFNLKCAIPEGYDLITEPMDNGNIKSNISPKDETKPYMILTIAFNEIFADTKRLNDVDAETLTAIENTFREEYEVEITYTETTYGTKLLMAKEVDGAVDWVDFYTIYEGYEIEIVMAQSEAKEGESITDEQIQIMLDFLSNLDFEEVK